MTKGTYYRLTKEGQEYLNQGLPEKNLVEFLNNHPKKSIKIEKAIAHIKRFHIGLKWTMDKGWIDREHDEIFLIRMPSEVPEQQALEKVAKGKEVDEKLLNVLLQRKLVEKAVIGDVDKLIGKEITELSPELLKTGIWKQVSFKPYNVEAVGKKLHIGKRQPYKQFLNEVKRKLIELGFQEMTGPLIETEFWNFDALFQPQNHPARDWTQTYQLKYPKEGKLPDKKVVENVKSAHEKGIAGGTGWGYRWNPKIAMGLMPRAHGTALSARTLASHPKIPGKYFAMVRCFRPDIIDATHGVEFNQTEGIVIDESLNFKNLLGILKMFATEIAGAEKVKFLPDYYPFTEPSAQLSALHPELGWIEFGGSGIFREELTKPLGVDEPVLAWGIGIDRLAMFKLDIKDIRYLFSQDLNWLRNKGVV